MMLFNDVSQWLEEQGFSRFVGLFEDNEIDGDVLLELTETDLEKLGIALGPRKKIIKAIAALNEQVQLSSEANSSGSSTVPPFDRVTRAGEAGRRQLTVMFCDLVGSTALSAQYDPEDLSEIVRVFQDTCAGIITRYEGYIARYMGDGMLVYFGYPQAHEDDTERALRAGLEIIDRVDQLEPRDDLILQTRIGVATGLVVAGETVGEASAQEKVVMGETPNLAARLQSLAQANQLVIANSTRQLCGDAFEFHNLGEQRLKGFDQPIVAYVVLCERLMESRFAARSDKRLLPIVGREQEIGLLTERWRLANSGEGQLVLLSGEAGIGKSRVTRAMTDAVANSEHYRITYQCSPYHSDTALHPAIQQLTQAAHILSPDDVESRFGKLEALLHQSGDTDAEQLALLASLIGLDGEDRYGALELTAQQKRLHTLRALADQLLSLSRQKPVLFVLEDVHWIDPTTQELIDLILDLIVNERVLILVTARPGFEHSFGSQTISTQFTLNRLGREHVRAIVARLANGKTLPNELLDDIVAKTDGVPLFVEELTKTILESGVLKETNSTFELAGSLNSLSIPTSLHDSLMARLDKLHAVKEVAQTAACIGREFDHSLLGSVTPLADKALQSALDRLVAAELVYRRGVSPDLKYYFKHALVRDVAYESLLKSKRQQIHKRLTEVLEEKGDVANQLIAQHATEAGLTGKAIEYWWLAGCHATKHSANREAIGHCKRGLAVISTLPESRERDQQELDFQSMLLSLLNTTAGWGSSETVAVNARARELSESLGDMAALLNVLRQERITHWSKAEYHAALEVADQMITLAEQQESDQSSDVYRRGDAGIGYYLRGWPLLALGEIAAVERIADKTLSWYDPALHGDYRFHYGIDLKAASLALRGYERWLSGYPEQARADNAKAIAYALELKHAGSLAWALNWAGTQPAAMNYDADGIETWAVELRALPEALRSPLDIAWARVYAGWALGKRGRRDEGILLIRKGLETLALKNVNILKSLHLALLAELYIDDNQFELAIETLHDARAHIDKTGERLWLSEIYRLMGEINWRRQPNARESTYDYFMNAIDIASELGAKSLELRAATSLAQYWQNQGQTSKACSLLTPIYNWFTEGLDTPGLKNAKTLLSTISRPPRH